MTLSQITPSRSGTATAWTKNASRATASSRSSKMPSKTGAGKFVFSFGSGKADGNETQKDLLGGKGANLHGMTRLGLPVPPGFTISTEVCTFFYANKKSYPKKLEAQ